MGVHLYNRTDNRRLSQQNYQSNLIFMLQDCECSFDRSTNMHPTLKTVMAYSFHFIYAQTITIRAETGLTIKRCSKVFRKAYTVSTFCIEGSHVINMACFNHFGAYHLFEYL